MNSPVKLTVVIPFSLAVLNALMMFVEVPLVVIPINTSPLPPNASTCLLNTSSKVKSFETAVKIDVLVVRAIDRSAFRLR